VEGGGKKALGLHVHRALLKHLVDPSIHGIRAISVYKLILSLRAWKLMDSGTPTYSTRLTELAQPSRKKHRKLPRETPGLIFHQQHITYNGICEVCKSPKGEAHGLKVGEGELIERSCH
jgi:hypothetical protein